ncbi:MAG: serine hydrolase [Chitinophagales bacterium]|nr:serine hydrolase [Chitinophagales bacterium]
MKNFLRLSMLFLFTIKIATAQVINIDSILQAAMFEKHVPGLSALILKKGIPVWQNNYGYARIEDSIPVTENTMFMLASISKTFISTAVMHAFEDGGINLDADINTYLPFEIHNPNYPDEIITLRQLLTHTSSLQDNWTVLSLGYTFGYDSPVTLGDFMKGYFVPGGAWYSESGNFYDEKPGTAYHYCNEGAALAAYILESIEGISFADYTQAKIFDPLCMNNTSWFLSGADTFNVAMPYRWKDGDYLANGYYCYPDYPNGQLRTSVISLAKFLAMIMNNGSWNGQQILSQSSIDATFSLQVPNLDSTQGIIWYQYVIGDRTCWGHSGGDAGVSTNMYFSPKDSTGIITLTNGNNFYLDGPLDALFDYAEGLEPLPGDSFTCYGFPTNVTAATLPNNTLSLYPNPASDYFMMEFSTNENEDLLIVMKNNLGQSVYFSSEKNAAKDFKKEILIPQLNDGIYFLEVKTAHKVITRKIVIAH